MQLNLRQAYEILDIHGSLVKYNKFSKAMNATVIFVVCFCNKALELRVKFFARMVGSPLTEAVSENILVGPFQKETISRYGCISQNNAGYECIICTLCRMVTPVFIKSLM